jgi:hypothetical protein
MEDTEIEISAYIPRRAQRANEYKSMKGSKRK